jgi:hypothetical protein
MSGAPDPHARRRTPLPSLRPTLAQLEAARELAQAPSGRLGRGAQLLLFAHSPAGTQVEGNAGHGLSLHSRHGELLLDLSESGESGVADELGGWAGANVELAPGSYRLRAAGGPEGATELMLTVAASHHTQVFVPRRMDARSGGSPLLQGALVLQGELGCGFDPRGPELDLTARITSALARPQRQEWRLLSEVFRAAQRSPFLALYGAHALLELVRTDGMGRAPETLALLEEALVRCLEQLGPLPDVLAVLLGLRLADALDPRSLRRMERVRTLASPSELRVWERPEGWTAPPMLFGSWRVVVESCIQSPRLVRSGSLLDQVAESVLAEGPWLLWRVSGRPARVELVPEHHPAGALAARAALDSSLRTHLREGADLAQLEAHLQPSRLERRLLVHLVQHRSAQLPLEAYLGDGPLIRALGAPWVTAQRTVSGLSRKLEARAQPGAVLGARRDRSAVYGAFGL